MKQYKTAPSSAASALMRDVVISASYEAMMLSISGHQLWHLYHQLQKAYALCLCDCVAKNGVNMSLCGGGKACAKPERCSACLCAVS